MSVIIQDVVVIGAGIVGAACAYRLAERGLSVSVLEQAPLPATGSTARSAAGVRVQFQDAVNIELSLHSIAEYRELSEADFRPTGYLMLVPPERWDAHLEGVRRQRAYGLDVRALTPQEAQAVVPFDSRGVAGCSYCPTDGAVDPHGLTWHYLRRARDFGATVRTEAPVTRIERRRGGWTLTTPQGTFAAPRVVNASGAWAREVGQLVGLRVPVTPARRMVFCSAPLDREHRFPMTFDLHGGVFLRSEGERLIFGKANARDSGWRETPDWDWLEPTIEAALTRFPWFESLRLDRQASWFGHYEMTPDGQAILGELPGAPGWHNACGFSGHGVMHAAATGRITAQDVLGEPLLVNIDPLRIDRFLQAGVRAGDIQL